MCVPPERSSAALVMISSESVSICNLSHARLVDSSRNRAFWRWYPNLMRSYGGHLEPRGSKFTLLKSTFNAKKFRAQVVLVYLQWCRRSSLLKCVSQPRITKNSLKPPILGVQGRLRSSIFVPRRARQQWLLWETASLCQSATVLMLNERIVVK